MRLNIRTIFFAFSTLIVVCIVSFWTNCSDQTFDTIARHIKPNYEVSNNLFTSKLIILNYFVICKYYHKQQFLIKINFFGTCLFNSFYFIFSFMIVKIYVGQWCILVIRW